MKTKIALLTVIGSILLIIPNHANAQGAIITWTGDGGYCTRISMTYDTLMSSVSASGDLVFQGPTDQGIASLVVSFYSPSSPFTPLYSITNVSNSVPLYRFLNITFNTASDSLSGSIDVGKDTFGEGLPGSSAGEYYLLGTITSPTLMDAGANLPLDSGGHFTVTMVPEPETWSLCIVALVLAIIVRLRGRPNTSLEPTGVGAGSWRSQRCHELDAPNKLFASRTVIATRFTSRIAGGSVLGR